ncbi:MAG: type II secretion system protein [Planctomycetota bacterium]
MRPTRPGRRGFTLIELLIVIGVIAVLAALIVPAAASARQTAQSTVTLQRLGQLATVGTLYATDNRDRIWTARDWLKTIEGDRALPGLLVRGEYITDGGVLECAINRRRLPLDRTGEPASPPPSLFANAEIDTDFAFVHQVEGARLGLHTRFAYYRQPRERGWSAGVWLDDGAALEPLPGVPLFVEEHLRFAHAWDEMATFKGFDQLERRHGGARGGQTQMAFLDGHAAAIAPPPTEDDRGLDVGDLTAGHFYLSAAGGRWRAMTLSDRYRYGWVNDPR